MTHRDEDQITLWSLMRLVTPTLIVITMAILASLSGQIRELDAKIFKHLTNDEIHMPRTMFVTKAEFDLITSVRNDQFRKIDLSLARIETSLEKHRSRE